MTARPKRDAAALFGRALKAHVQGLGHAITLADIRARPWASATFEGERVELSAQGADPAWTASLGEAGLDVRGYLVADLVARPMDAATVRVEALLIRDA